MRLTTKLQPMLPNCTWTMVYIATRDQWVSHFIELAGYRCIPQGGNWYCTNYPLEQEHPGQVVPYLRLHGKELSYVSEADIQVVTRETVRLVPQV